MRGVKKRISSVVFGLRSFNCLNRELLAVIMSDLHPANPAFEIRTFGGSMIQAVKVNLSPDGIMAEVTGLGPFRLDPAEVMSLRRLRFQNSSP